MTKKTERPGTAPPPKRKTSPPGSGARAVVPPPIPGASLPKVSPPAPPRPGARAPAPPQTTRMPAVPAPPAPASSRRSPSAHPTRSMPAVDDRVLQIDALGKSLGELKELVANVALELEKLARGEPGLTPGGKASVGELALALRKAAGVPAPKGPPPIPSALKHNTSLMPPALDISEMAELVESLSPPPIPQVPIDDEGW
ncbi:MAG: hypothetical protein JNM74_25415 [Myxococcales bacterium]|nr:hypothetical protein [Myxococcales bacterium]